jgi:ABC-type transport system involved in multi-copper enzyme maturation permease subunit
MRPYLAVVKDSFREALRSPVLWIVIVLIACLLLALAPIGSRTETTVQLNREDVLNWEALGKRIQIEGGGFFNSPSRRIWSLLSPELKQRITKLNTTKLTEINESADAGEKLRLELNKLLERRDLYDAGAWRRIDLGAEGKKLQKDAEQLGEDKVGRFNRILLDRAYPDLIKESPPTSTRFTYLGYDNPEYLPPENPELFVKNIHGWINWIGHWGVGAVVVLVAILITAPIMVRMFDQGQLHLLLSKPVSRSPLLVGQFFGGCAYVAILVTFLMLGLWLICGSRFGIWEARLLWVIPIYAFVFAIYYSVSVFAAIITRNSIVAIIACILFWALCFGIGTAKLALDYGMRVAQFNRIVPAGDDLLAVDERNAIYVWNQTERRWDRVFVSRLQAELEQNPALRLLMAPPMPGIAYDKKGQQLVAVERNMFGGAAAQVGVGREQNNWDYVPSLSPPVGTFVMLEEPGGTFLLAGNFGLFRLQGDLTARREPIKVLGMALPLQTGAIFQDVSPPEGLLMPPPSSAAIDAKTGKVVVYSRGELILLEPRDRKFGFVKRRKLDLKETESAVVAIGGQRIVLGLPDGQVKLLDAKSLAEMASDKPNAKSEPRFISASPDGKQYAMVMQDETLWLLAADSDGWHRARLNGQRDISCVHWSDDGKLYVADRSTRVTVYDANTLAQLERFSPRESAITRSYRYAIVPLYYLLPKPGELYKTFDYLVEKKKSDDKTEASVAKSNANPFAPVYSGLAFIAFMLTCCCVYFERQEF